MEPYRLEDSESDWLTITEHDGRPGAALLRSWRAGVEVKPDNIPAVTAAFYRACGIQPPVILDLPDIPQDGAQIRYGSFAVKLSNGGVTVSLPGIEPLPVPPRAARELAAYIVAYADLAEEEPDPDGVEELANVIHAGTHQAGCGLGPTDENRAAAHAALRWMNARKTAAS